MWAALALVLMILISPNLVESKQVNVKQEVKITQSVKIQSVQWWESVPPPIARNKKPMPEIWWTWVKQSAKRWGVNPFHIASLMDVECNGFDKPGGEPLGRGKNSRKYISPCGFNRHNQIPWEMIWIPEKQIDRCAWLLRGPDLQKRLRSYNSEYTKRYGYSVENNSWRMENDAWKIYLKKGVPSS